MKKYTFSYNYEIDNQGTGFETKDVSKFSDEELFLLEQADLLNIAKIEAWAAVGNNIRINYSTHGLFRYFGKFPSTVASFLIQKYTNVGDKIMDPMCGSGTTAVEALLMDRECSAYDINPLSVLISKVKTTYIPKETLIKTLDYISSNYKPLSLEEFNWAPVGLRNIDHWFLPKTQDSLRGLIKLINEITDKNVKDFFTVSLASSIRIVSRATSQQGRLFLDVETALEDVLSTFQKRSLRAIDRVSEIPVDNSKIEIKKHNSFDSFPNNEKNKLVICHPPYFNNYKYSSVNSLELAWLKIDHASVRKNEVREFFKVGKPENSEKYIEDMTTIINNLYSTIETNGVLALMIGDTVIKGEYIKVTKPIINNILEIYPKLEIEKVVLRVPKFTEASWASSQRRNSKKIGISLNDFIIIFRKKE